MSSSLNKILDAAAKSIVHKLSTMHSQEQKKIAPAYGFNLSDTQLPGNIHADYNRGMLGINPQSILGNASMQTLKLS